MNSNKRLSKVKTAAFTVTLTAIIWEGLADYLKTVTSYSSIILPTIEDTFTSGFAGLSNFWGGGMFSGQGATNSYVLALFVLAQNSLITVLRLFAGILLGITLGIAIGIEMGRYSRLRKFLEPPIDVIRAFPLLALIPLFMYWFGTSELGRLVYIAYGAATIIVINTINAIDNVSPTHQKFAYTMGASHNQMFRTVILPAIMPELAGGIRVVLGLSWAIVLAAEYLNALSGLGRILILSEIHLFTDRMIIIVILFIIFSLVVNSLFIRFSRHATRWMSR